MADQDTINVTLSADDKQFIRTGYELIHFTQETQRTIPVCYGRVSVGGPGDKKNDLELPGLPNRQAVLHYNDGQLFLTNQNNASPCTVNGKVSNFKQLCDGDVIEVGEHKLLVRNVLDQLGSLEAYPDRNRTWTLIEEPNTIGRPGKRQNRIDFEDPTVSRVQATIHYHDGAFQLEAETSSSPTLINGELIPQGEPRWLEDGDILQFGKQMVRFRAGGRSAARRRDLVAQEATILFSDIWNYSSLSESRPLEETIRQMNEFYRALGKVIEAHSGILMTFLGDAMMAVFGSDGDDPEAPCKAVRAALAMQARLDELNASWTERGLPTMRIGVGINTGEVMVGDVGFTGRLEFAAMGDNTNLAARLEKLTREHEAGIIVSGSTRSALGPEFQVKSLGSTKVKGRQADVEIYQVLGEGG